MGEHIEKRERGRVAAGIGGLIEESVCRRKMESGCECIEGLTKTHKGMAMTGGAESR